MPYPSCSPQCRLGSFPRCKCGWHLQCLQVFTQIFFQSQLLPVHESQLLNSQKIYKPVSNLWQLEIDQSGSIYPVEIRPNLITLFKFAIFIFFIFKSLLALSHSTFSFSLSNGTCRLISYMYVYVSYFICACMLRSSVMSNSVQSQGLQPARLLCPWNFQGKYNAVGCHFLLQVIFLTQGSNPHNCVSCISSEFFTIVPSGNPLIIYIHTHTHTHTHTYMYMFIYVCVCIYACIYMYVCVQNYTYLNNYIYLAINNKMVK